MSLFKCHRPNGIGIAFVERVTFGLQSLSSSKRIDVKNDIMPVGDSEAFFQRFDENPFHQFIGLSVADIADDYACLRLTVTRNNAHGYRRQREWRRVGDDGGYGGSCSRIQ